jgi:hypothetical protein
VTVCPLRVKLSQKSRVELCRARLLKAGLFQGPVCLKAQLFKGAWFFTVRIVKGQMMQGEIVPVSNILIPVCFSVGYSPDFLLAPFSRPPVKYSAVLLSNNFSSLFSIYFHPFSNIIPSSSQIFAIQLYIIAPSTSPLSSHPLV